MGELLKHYMWQFQCCRISINIKHEPALFWMLTENRRLLLFFTWPSSSVLPCTCIRTSADHLCRFTLWETSSDEQRLDTEQNLLIAPLTAVYRQSLEDASTLFVVWLRPPKAGHIFTSLFPPENLHGFQNVSEKDHACKSEEENDFGVSLTHFVLLEFFELYCCATCSTPKTLRCQFGRGCGSR